LLTDDVRGAEHRGPRGGLLAILVPRRDGAVDALCFCQQGVCERGRLEEGSERARGREGERAREREGERARGRESERARDGTRDTDLGGC